MTGKKILIVDDSDLVAGILTEHLSGQGYDVCRAKNGFAGIRKAYSEMPDCIIMDVEMPLLQGYLASRLLKSRRGVDTIPIVMHTSRSDDRDKYWARSSGADSFMTKDFDNLDDIIEEITALIDKSPVKRDLITADRERASNESIVELLSNTIDNQLFKSTILNELSDISRDIHSLDESSEKILALLGNVCETHIAVVHLVFQKKLYTYTYAGEGIREHEVDEFLQVCQGDLTDAFPETHPVPHLKKIYGIEDNPEYKKIRIDKKNISSYISMKLEGKNDTIGMLHIGNYLNNYFSDTIRENIQAFADGAGMILENALLMKHITDMEGKIRNVFSKFVPGEIIDDLIEKEQRSGLLSGEKRNVAVLFSDIRSFTTISENNRPEDVVSFLNDFFEIMVFIIQSQGGTIDKFIGDALLAVFGAPQSYTDNAGRAVKAAKQMLETLDTFQYDSLKLPEGGVRIGIGIHEGDVIVGNIGSSRKYDYTVIGDAVNLASRIEGLTKFYNAPIIVSETVKEKTEDTFTYREIDSVRVKGKDIAVKLYTLQDEDIGILDEETMGNYLKAVSMYRIRNWQTAVEYFNKVLEKFPDDHISKIYIERCAEYEKSPPGEEWDGSATLGFK